MRKKLTLVFMTVFLFGMIGALSTQAAPTATTAPTSKSAVTGTIKVGVLAAISGDLQALGEGITDGIKAAAYEINNSAQFGFDIELFIEDSKADPTAALTAYAALKARNVQLIIGATGSAASIAVAEQTATDHIVQISYSSTNAGLTNASYDYFYRTVPSDAFQAVAVEEVVAHYGFEKVVIINRGDAWGSGLAADLGTSLGAGVLDTIEYADGTTDFAAAVTSIKAQTAAEAIIMISFPEDGRAFMTELRESGVTLPVIGTDGTGDSTVVDKEKAPNSDVDFERNVGTKPHASVAGEGAYDEYVAALTACKTASICVDNVPTRQYGDSAYDAMWVGALAVNMSSAYDGVEIKSNMAAAGAGFVGATGNKTFDSFGDISTTYDIWQFQDGAIKIIGSWDVVNGVQLNSSAKDLAWPGRPASTPGFELIVAIFAVGTFVAIRKRH